mgnify:FL=1
MEYKLLAVGLERETNIGDYIQALASSQFLPRIDGFIERECLKDYSGEECKVIMNGWYMHNPSQWPPSDNINPLFIAVHFNSKAKKDLLDADSIKYLKQHEPIGCRDWFTQRMLKDNGVDAYFSGCMTLTLGYKYGVSLNQRDDKIYFVDPYFRTNWGIKSIIVNALYLITFYRRISSISSKYPSSKTGLRKKMILTTFFREYSKFFSQETLLNAEYICQQYEAYTRCFPNNPSRLQEAERLVKKYARASLVVTSRIHCALPCLGLQTPVIYTEDAQQAEASSCRLEGLRELFNILSWNKDHLEAQFETVGLIDKNNKPVNRDAWKSLAQKIINRIKDFVYVA